MPASVLERIVRLLEEHGIPYRRLHHAPTRTSEESARVRNEDIAIGAKALVMKLDDVFALFVISAARRVDSKKLRAHLKARKSRFATPDELAELTGLVPGSVPPFGRPVLDLDLYADASVFANDRVAFNAGSLTDSIIMASADYRRLARPTVFDFSR